MAWIEHCRKEGKRYGDNIYLNFRDMIEFYGKLFNPTASVVCTNKSL